MYRMPCCRPVLHVSNLYSLSTDRIEERAENNIFSGFILNQLFELNQLNLNPFELNQFIISRFILNQNNSKEESHLFTSSKTTLNCFSGICVSKSF